MWPFFQQIGLFFLKNPGTSCQPFILIGLAQTWCKNKPKRTQKLRPRTSKFERLDWVISYNGIPKCSPSGSNIFYSNSTRSMSVLSLQSCCHGYVVLTKMWSMWTIRLWKIACRSVEGKEEVVRMATKLESRWGKVVGEARHRQGTTTG